MDLRTFRLPIFIFLVASAGCGASREQASGEFGAVPGEGGKPAPAAAPVVAPAPATVTVTVTGPNQASTTLPATGAASETPAADAASKPINTRCPVTGEALGADAVLVTVTTEVIQPPRTYVIACKDDAAAKKVSAEPNKYIPAALHNVEARHDTDPIENVR